MFMLVKSQCLFFEKKKRKTFAFVGHHEQLTTNNKEERSKYSIQGTWRVYIIYIFFYHF